MPDAYLLPDYCSTVVTNLQRQGVEVRVLREDVELEASDARAAVADKKTTRRFSAGTFVVRDRKSTRLNSSHRT